jgi:hypothetical protein
MSTKPDQRQRLKKVNFEREVQDRETGEVTLTEREIRIDREPDYIKLYLSGILLYADCAAWQNRVLHSLLKLIDFNNEINITAHKRKQIATELEMTTSALNIAITKFVRGSVLKKLGTGTYLANPHLFGRGEWKNIRKLRLTVEFSPEGVSMQGDVTKEEPFDDSLDNAALASIAPINPTKLIAFLKDPANHTETIALSTIGSYLGMSLFAVNQLFNII